MSFVDATRTKQQLLAENAMLRQQLIIATRNTRPRRWPIRPWDRALLVVMSAFAVHWRDALLIVNPDTLLRWHRQGFKLFWRRKTRHGRPRSSPLAPETIELIRAMAAYNKLWGAERIRGELLKLGIHVSKRTIQKYMRPVRRTRRSGQRWMTFVRNHVHETWACDFVQTYDILFRPIFAFFIIELGTRRVVHFNVTRQPSGRWTAQQLREATAWCKGPRFLIRDRDDKFGGGFDAVAKACGTRVLKTPVRAPTANAFCERFIGSARRECLDHVIILSEKQMRARLQEYIKYFNGSRPHQGNAQRVPNGTAHTTEGRVISLPVLGGLHYEYRRAA